MLAGWLAVANTIEMSRFGHHAEVILLTLARGTVRKAIDALVDEGPGSPSPRKRHLRRPGSSCG